MQDLIINETTSQLTRKRKLKLNKNKIQAQTKTDHLMTMVKIFEHFNYGKCMRCRGTKYRGAFSDIIFILMYLSYSFFPIKIVSHEKRNPYVRVPRYPKIANPSSNDCIYNRCQLCFWRLSFSCTLSLSVSPAACPFPLLSA